MFDGFADWLAGITWPIVSRVFASIGLGTVTYTGASTAIDGALNAASTALNGLSGDVAAIMVRAGFFDAMAITAGGLVSGIGWLVLKRFALNAGAPQ